MIVSYAWHRADALLRAKVNTARRLLGRTDSRTAPAERVRLHAAVQNAEEALRVHQTNKPLEENDRE